jgi:predicted transcriptional regulator
MIEKTLGETEMTTGLTVSITDELVAELEEIANRDSAVRLTVRADHLRQLLAERAELKRDAERYRWLRERIENKGDMVIAKCSELSIESWSGDDPDAAIDAAMQSEAKP